jgi:hypothetical protein
MVTKPILREIRKAIQNPEEYASGEGKTQLRASFDAMTSQAYASIFGQEPLSRMNARQELNAAQKKKYTAAKWKLILRLREAMKASELSLHASDYSDHGEDIQGFIKDELKGLYEVLNER